ncbi:MAG: hypothetical protein OXI08_01650 [Cyanobacteria bacterium MAG IRC4_bin_6]|nr:hypothetical protein [Cyanobacteria bacterium MAG IRC3_bin_20]MDE0646769.1 hypothetical protein [Cyanobacteria bacterium MAG IRC4_bin_6]
MTEITEGNLTFRFPDGCQASQYDHWSFYKNQFQSVTSDSTKAVDILCIKGDTSWLIEIKDHRQHTRQKLIDIADETAIKVRNTLAGLAAAAKVANDVDQRELAKTALATSRWRVVLHLEQPATARRTWKNAIGGADLFQKKFKGKGTSELATVPGRRRA